ncbi:MAG: hypothetical protein PHN75_03465 [Syntrophales bacterium]|nr:hypothetical protein [Syntrophales bacterium]
MSQKESPFDLSFLGEKLDVSKYPPLQIVTGKGRAVSSLKVQPPAVVASNPASRGMVDLMNDIVNDASKDATKAAKVADTAANLNPDDAARLIAALMQEMMKPENISLWLKTVNPDLMCRLAAAMMQTASTGKM